MREKSLSFLVIVTVTVACGESTPSRRQRIDDEQDTAPTAPSETTATGAERARQSLREHLRLRLERGEMQISTPRTQSIGLAGVGATAEPAASSGPGVKPGATTVRGRLPPEVIQRIVRQNFGRLRLCYEHGLRSDPKLSGRVDVKFTIGTDGYVSGASATGTMPDQAVVACVTKAISALSFPAPEGGVVVVTYPISFTPGS